MEQVGEYELEGELGRGAFGAVYRALAPDGRQVALKLLLSTSGSEAAQRRFAQEVQALLRLRHPQVIALIDAGEDRGRRFLVTEWVEGETLEAHLRLEGPLDPRRAAALVRSLALALHYCHGQGVLHRDLKPQNVILRGATGEPLLLDFGLSLDAHALEESLGRLTREGMALGTPGYWAPEQARGELERIGVRADVYGLGGLLHAALTGQAPQPGDSLQETLRALEREPEPPSRLRAGLPPALDAICLRCLALAPEARFPTAAAVAAELARWLEPGVRQPRGGARSLVLLAGGLALGALPVAWVARGRAAARPAGDAPPAPADAGSVPPGRARAIALTERASRTAEAGDLAGAIALLDAAEAADPLYTRPLHLRSRLRVNTGDLAGGQADLERILALDPTDVAAWRGRAGVRMYRREFAGALEDLGRALEQDPTDFLAGLQRGMLRRLMGDAPGAVEELRRVVVRPVGKGEADAWSALGGALAEVGERAQALEAYTRAIELRPDWAQPWANRGELRRAAGELPAAIEDCGRALALEPGNLQALRSRARARRSTGDRAGALADAEAGLAREAEDHILLGVRAMSRLDGGDREGARSDLERLLARHPDDAAAAAVLKELRGR